MSFNYISIYFQHCGTLATLEISRNLKPCLDWLALSHVPKPGHRCHCQIIQKLLMVENHWGRQSKESHSCRMIYRNMYKHRNRKFIQFVSLQYAPYLCGSIVLTESYWYLLSEAPRQKCLVSFAWGPEPMPMQIVSSLDNGLVGSVASSNLAMPCLACKAHRGA